MDGWITIGTKLDTKSFDKQIKQLERELDAFEDRRKFLEAGAAEYGGFTAKGAKEYEKVQVQIERTKNKLIQLRQAKERATQTKDVDNFGKSFKQSIKHIGRLILGIFGIRSAYMALRRASSELASYDPQYAANLEYIRYVLTQAIAPVLRWIVQIQQLQ